MKVNYSRVLPIIWIISYPIISGQYQLSMTLLQKIYKQGEFALSWTPVFIGLGLTSIHIRTMCPLNNSSLWHPGTLRWPLSILDFDTHLFKFFQVLLGTTRYLFYWLLVDCYCRGELLLITLSSESHMLVFRPFNCYWEFYRFCCLIFSTMKTYSY
jgi:hypothetical protein